MTDLSWAAIAGTRSFISLIAILTGTLADKAIYLVPTKNIIQWGERIYYYNCHRQSGSEFAWYRNNLPNGLLEKNITVNWVFGERWNPTIY